MKRKFTLEDVCVRIERWEKRVRRAENALSKLNTQRRRLERKAKLVATAKVAPVEPRPEWVFPAKPIPVVLPSPEPEPGSLDIPDYLKRVQAGRDRDALAAKAIQEQKDNRQAERKRLRASGVTKKMPLTGKAALAAIRG